MFIIIKRSMVKTTIWFTLMLYHTQLITTILEVCPVGWFGAKCSFKCNCLTSCQADGQCEPHDTCRRPYFGFSCQYRDVSNSSTSKLATDWNDKTCITNTVDQLNISIKSTVFTFFRIIANNIMGIKSITLSLHNDVNSLVSCGVINQSQTWYRDDKFVSDIYCDTNDTVTFLRLTGLGLKYICSVYVSGGRNLALKQKPSVGSLHASDRSGNGLTDGVIPQTFDSVNCIYTDTVDRKPWAVVSFNQPVRLQEIVVHNTADQQYWAWLNSFIVSTYDETDQLVLEFNHTGGEAERFNVRHTTISSVISSVKIELPNDGILMACELEAYGDCPLKTYGLDCASNCSDACYNSLCDIEGNCLSCSPGNYSSNCLLACSSQCVNNSCDKSSGECSQGCVSGYHGTICDKACSSTCMNNVCDATSGTCTEGCIPGYDGPSCSKVCGSGYYGHRCGLKCNSLCATNCSNINGTCNVCPPVNYGPVCEHTCSEHCINEKCRHTDGSCVEGCNIGYYGYSCSQECSKGCIGTLCLWDGSCLDGCVQGFFSENCTIECSKNCGGSGRCNSTLDYCLEGCKPGFYGLDCTKACDKLCSGDGSCDINTGSCTKLNLEHNSTGNFSSDEHVACSDHCGGDKSCNTSTGHCHHGCVIGYGGLNCFLECTNCVGKHCEQKTLKCTEGCVNGFSGSNCSLKSLKSKMSEDGQDKGSWLTVSIVAIFLVSLIWFAIQLALRRKTPKVEVIFE